MVHIQFFKTSVVCCFLYLLLSVSVFAQQSERIAIDNSSNYSYFSGIIDFLEEIPSYSGRLRFGPVQISPTLEISETFDDNVFSAPNNKVGDFYTTYEPGILLELPFMDHSLKFDYHAEINDYARDYTDAEEQDNVTQFLVGSLNLNFKNGFSISLSNQIKAMSVPGGRFERRENGVVLFDDGGGQDDIEAPEEFGINSIRDKRNITTNKAKILIDFPDYFNRLDFDLHYSNLDVSYQRAEVDDNEHNDDTFGVGIEIKPLKRVNIKMGFDYGIIRYDTDENKDSIIRKIPFEIRWQPTVKSEFFFRTSYNLRDYGSESEFKNFSGYDATLGYKFNMSEKDKLTVKFERSIKEQKFRTEQNIVDGIAATVADDNPYFFTQFNIDYVHSFSRNISFTFSPYIQTLRFQEQVNVDGDNGGVVPLPREKVDAVGLEIMARYDAPKKWFFGEISYKYEDRNNNFTGADMVSNVGEISVGLSF